MLLSKTIPRTQISHPYNIFHNKILKFLQLSDAWLADPPQKKLPIKIIITK